MSVQVSSEGASSSLHGNQPRIQATFRQLSDLFLLAEGGYQPVTSFMSAMDVSQVAEKMHLTTGEPWSIPIIFPVSSSQAEELKRADYVVLMDGEKPAGTLQIRDIFPIDKSQYARNVFRTEDSAHPGVAWLEGAGSHSLGGVVETFADWQLNILGGLPFAPRAVRENIKEKGWKKIVGFQTRNPIHRAHEFITKIALETADGIVIHPLLGETKADDTSADVRLACYHALVDNYYSPRHTLLAGFPAWMRYAGPREAIFHAQVRRNYGITHFIVGRDHAGVGDFYGPFDAQEIFAEFERDELGIEPLFFDFVHFCKACGGMTSPKSCPHDKENYVHLSGSAVRAMLSEGKLPPPEFTRPEVAKILLEASRQ